jgi:hypothetical protein
MQMETMLDADVTASYKTTRCASEPVQLHKLA